MEKQFKIPLNISAVCLLFSLGKASSDINWAGANHFESSVFQNTMEIFRKMLNQALVIQCIYKNVWSFLYYTLIMGRSSMINK